MSARALIVSGTNASRFRIILALQDGAPGTENEPRAGLVLRDTFNTQPKVEALLALGDLRSLTPDHGTPTPHPAPFHATAGSIVGGLTDVQAAARENDAEWLYFWTGMQWLHLQIDLSLDLAVYEGGDPYPMTPVTSH